MGPKDFGYCIQMLKAGHKMRRKGWNGKGIFIVLILGFVLEQEAKKAHNDWMEVKKKQGVTSRKSETGEELMVPYAELTEIAKELDRKYANKPEAMTHDYIAIDTTGLQTDNSDAPKSRVPWLASQTDMLSEDWELVTI